MIAAVVPSVALPVALLVALPVILAAPAARAGDQATAGTETATDIVAAAVRERGYPCAQPRAASPDPQASLPDRAAWTVQCEQGAFTVIFEGDTGPRVSRLP